MSKVLKKRFLRKRAGADRVKLCASTGVDGVVIGFLTADGRIGIERTRAAVNIARPMIVLVCSDPDPKSLFSNTAPISGVEFHFGAPS